MPRLHASITPASRQRGAALFIILLLIVVSAGIVFVSRLRSAAVELEAQRKTAAALAEAKQALLGRAASDGDPGSLPCPSIDSTAGIANTWPGGGGMRCGSATTKSNFGWLPWRTLRVGQLYDGSASLLWYMLASGYVDKGTYSPPPNAPTLTVTITVVDVDPTTLGETIVTSSSIPNVAAAIIAPGPPLSGQNRSGAARTDSSFSGAYFEGSADSTSDTLTIKIEQKRDHPLLKYNDQYLLIMAREVLDQSTSAVAKSFAGELSGYYTTSGGVYPPTGWLPSGGAWSGSQTYAPWVAWDPVAGQYPTSYTATGPAVGQVRFSGCASMYTIQQTAGGAQVSRSGHC